MTAGLHLVAQPAVDEHTNRNGRVTRPATPASVRCMTSPATVWDETSPDRLEAAAAELLAAAHWLRTQANPKAVSPLRTVVRMAALVDDRTSDEQDALDLVSGWVEGL